MHENYNGKKKKRIRRIISIGLGLILISALFQYFIIISNRTKAQYAIRLEETGIQIAEGVRRHLNSSVSFVKGMAEVFAQYDDIHSEEALELLTRVDSNNDFKRMWLTKADGKAKSSKGKDSDATGRAYLEAALRGESGVSEIQYSKVDGERNVVIYAPIYHKGEITGVVIGIYALDELADIINIECFGGEGYSHIVKQDGEIVALSKHKSVLNQSAQQIEYWNEYGYSCPIGINDWKIFVTLPQSVIDKDFQFNLLLSIMIWVEFTFVLCVVLVDRYRIKNSELRRLAQIDSMTELLNRGTIEDTINFSLKEKPEEKGMFVLFDVDHFKQVNDTLGHVAGDVLLKKIADIMNDEFRKLDILGRLGGDEFVIYMRGVEDMEITKRKIEHFLGRINEIGTELTWKTEIAISIGIAVSPEDGTNFESLYQVADANMYEAKKKAGNSVVGIE